MAFTVQDYHDLVQLLVNHPEWKSELQGLLLSEELLTLPSVVRELAEAQRDTEKRLAGLTEVQKRTEERLSRLETTVQHLTEGQQRLTQQVMGLTEQVTGLTEQVAGLTQQVTGLTQQVTGLTEQVTGLTQQVTGLTQQVERLDTGQRRLINIVGRHQGRLLEIGYRQNVGAYFGRHLRRPQVVNLAEHVDALEEHLDAEAVAEVFRLDLVVNGSLRAALNAGEVWLAMEISSTVETNDVERVVRRANLLRQAGYQAIPVVAGEEITGDATTQVRSEGVVLLQDGRIDFWDEAVSRSAED